MSIFAIVLIGFSLAVDAFTVAMSNAITIPKKEKYKNIIIIFSFAIAQGIMPIMGYFLGQLFIDYIKIFDHWIILFLLSGIGAKMIYDSISSHNNITEVNCNNNQKSISISLIFVQAIATSIDAFAVGISISLGNANIFLSSLIISTVTIICCLFAVCLGRFLGDLFQEKAQIIGGIILIVIGLNIFIKDLLML